MEKQKVLQKLLSCVLCEEKFKKTNKPLIMLCGHNICEECKLKNFKKVTCKICKKVFSKREIKKFPINYSILENKNISHEIEPNHRETNPDINSIITPEECENLMSAMNQFLKNINLNKKNEEKKEEEKKEEEKNMSQKSQDEIEGIIKKRELMIKETHEFIENLEQNYFEYFNRLFNFIIKALTSNSELLIKDLKISQLLEETGVINYGDMIKLIKFLEIMEEIDKEDLNNCSSFEQIYSLIIDKNSNVKYEEFISLFFFFNKIFELKIKKIQKIFESQKKLYSNKKECNKNLSHFITNFIQKNESNLSDMFYDITTYKPCHFLYNINTNENIKNSLKEYYNLNQKVLEEYNNILILYEPIEKKLNIHIIKIKELNEEKIIDTYLFLNHSLFILTNKNFYNYQINDEKYFPLYPLNEPEFEENSKIIKYDIFMMILSSNSFQSINLRKDMTKNDWRSISLFEDSPGIIKKPYPICHSSNVIYVIDRENKNINEVYTFNPENDSWDKKEIKLEIDSKNDGKNKNNIKIINHNKKLEQEETIILKQLLLEDFHLFNKCFACIWGGRHPISKKFNKNVYSMDLVKCIMKKIISFDEFITDDMVIIDLNVGILNKHIDFVFVYHLINDDKNIKIKIIRKEIIENDISIETKLKVLMDINISEISSNKFL